MTEVRVRRSRLDSGEPMRLDVGSGGVCLVRIADEYHAVGDRCSHANVSLSEGAVDVDDCTIECPKHGSAFSLRDGRPSSLPATRPVPVYLVVVDGEDVVVTVP